MFLNLVSFCQPSIFVMANAATISTHFLDSEIVICQTKTGNTRKKLLGNKFPKSLNLTHNPPINWSATTCYTKTTKIVLLALQDLNMGHIK